MIRALAFSLALILAAPAAAQNLPALYSVTDVAADDTLNIRSGPSVDFEIVGKLQPDATGIEVVDTNDEGDWGLIAMDEGRGWVALRYLRRAEGQPANGLPRTLNCTGTEPFWSFSLTPDRKAEFARPEKTIAFNSVLDVQSRNRTDRYALFADGGDVVVTSMVGRNLCSDGMSDRPYGLSIDLLVTDETTVSVYSGCCSVSP